jgi:hypothetical protein
MHTTAKHTIILGVLALLQSVGFAQVFPSNQGTNAAQFAQSLPTGTNRLQTAQNPSSQWLFQEVPIVEEPLTRQVISGVVRVAAQPYLIKLSGAPNLYKLSLQLRETPSNDYFSNAIPVVFDSTNGQSLSSSGAAYNMYSTTESGEIRVKKGNTVWYQINSKQAGMVTIDANPMVHQQSVGGQDQSTPLSNPVMTVWQGTNIGQLQLLLASPSANPDISGVPYLYPNEITFAVSAGSTYFLRVDASDVVGDFILRRQLTPKAPNDQISNALLLTSMSTNYDNGFRYGYQALSANFQATTEVGETIYHAHSVWFQIITPAAGYLSISLSTNAMDLYNPVNPAILSVTNLTATANDQYVLAGTTVLICVYGPENTFTLSATLTTVPSNDFRTNSINLTQDTTNYIYNYYATAGEPADDIIGDANNSIWWNFLPQDHGTLVIRNPEANFDHTYFKLTTAAGVIQPYDSRAGQTSYRLPDMSDLWFRLTVPENNRGEGHVVFQLHPDPPNDRRTNATLVEQYSFRNYDNGDVYLYTIDGIDNGSTQPEETLANTVWYRWQAPMDCNAQVSVSSTNVQLLVYDGTGTNLSSNPAPLRAGEALYVAVGGGIDTFTLSIDCRKVPANDEPTGATTLILGRDFSFYTKYATLNPSYGGAAGDIWATYDPAAIHSITLYAFTSSTQQAVFVQAMQNGQMIASQTFSNLNRVKLPVACDPSQLVTLRLLVLQPDTDMTLLVEGEPSNDDFDLRQRIDLIPTTQVAMLNGNRIEMTKFTTHIIADNTQATLEEGEISTAVSVHDPMPLSGRSLWWQVTTPVDGVFSIKPRGNSARLHIELTPAQEFPTSIRQFTAWNSLLLIYDSIPQDNIVTFVSAAGQTYNIRMDTALADFGQPLDFDVSQIPIPQNDNHEWPAEVATSTRQVTTYYKEKYPCVRQETTYTASGTIFGATRQYNGAALESTAEALLVAGASQDSWDKGQLPWYPAWQTIWFKLTPAVNENVVVQATANFRPFIAVSAQEPGMQAKFDVTGSGSVLALDRQNSYYFLVDALVPVNQTFSGNRNLFKVANGPQTTDTPYNVGLQGWNSDINRDCEDAIAGAIALTLTSTSGLQNDSIRAPATLSLEPGYVTDSCAEPNGSYLARASENNVTATRETDPALVAPDNLGGAGKTLWWKVTAVKSGDMTIDATDSEIPVLIKVLINGPSDGGAVYSGGRATFSAVAGVAYEIGIDSVLYTQGWIAFTVAQTMSRPINDMFTNATEIISPLTCGILDVSSIEPFESTSGTGSIWYRIHNYGTNAQNFLFQLSSTNAFMELYRNGGGIQSSIQVAPATNYIAYTSQPRESDYIRVFCYDAPPSGRVQLSTAAEPDWYKAQVFITPSDSFLGSMEIRAYSLSSLLPRVYYSTGETTTNSTVYTASFTITNTETIDFLVQIPNLISYHVTNTYTRLPDLDITPSCQFSNSMVSTINGSRMNNTVTYRIGAGDGTAPVQQNWLPFPTDGLQLTESAEIDFLVTAGNGTASILQRHYTNTVAEPTATSAGPMLTIRTPTPQASLQIGQGGYVQDFSTNQITMLAVTPQVQMTASRAGWVASSARYTFVPTLGDLEPLVLVTNSITPQNLRVTLFNNNPLTVIWYTIKHDNTMMVSTSALYSVSINLPYTADLEAYAGTPELSSMGPKTALHFDATLLMPTITLENNILYINNPNTLPSNLHVNDIDVGIGTFFAVPVIAGMLDTAFATSSWAGNSPTNTFEPAVHTNLSFSPPGQTFTQDLPVTITAEQGNLTVNIETGNGASQTIANAGRSVQVTLDRSAQVSATAQIYGRTIASVTNIYTAQVGNIASQMPDLVSAGIYNSLSPVILSCETPGTTFRYRVNGTQEWTPLPANKLTLLNGSFTYNIEAAREGWTSATMQTNWTATPSVNQLVDYVASYYVIFPGTPPIPADITATNSALVDYGNYTYVHYVWLSGGSPETDTHVYISDPVRNLTVFHQVIKYFHVSDTVAVAEDTGPIQQSIVTVLNFDWRVVHETTNDLTLVVASDTNISDNVYFYKPTWIQSWTNMQLQAVTEHAAYSLEPLRNPTNDTLYLIPGNMYSDKDYITLRYWHGAATNSFKIRFRTLMPAQYRDSQAPDVVLVGVNPVYAGHDVGVYYAAHSGEPDTQPFTSPVAIQDLFGTVRLTDLANGTNVWKFNSRYHLDGLTNYFRTGLPPLPVYDN